MRLRHDRHPLRRRRHRNRPGRSTTCCGRSASSEFTIHVNNRLVLTGLLERLGLDRQSTAILRALDKLAKIGPEQVAEEMPASGRRHGRAGRQRARRLIRARRRQRRSPRAARPLVAGSETRPGRRRPARRAARRRHAPPACRPTGCKLDVSIARGLDYYTGTVFETYARRSARRSAASAPAAATTIWPSCTPTSSCPASARRSASIDCWRPWKSSS